MNPEQAKEILAMFRPGTTDQTDPFFADALAALKTDDALREWFERQLKTDATLRAKLRQVAVPPHLKRKILAIQRPAGRVVWFRRPAVWAAAAAVVGLIALIDWSLSDREADTPARYERAADGVSPGKIDFATYRKKMARIVSANYKMSFKSTDLEKLREYLGKNSGHADYRLTPALESLPGQGTAVLKWRSKTVSLICLESEQRRTLYLFITNRANVAGAPDSSPPQFAEVENLASASWSQNDKTYILMLKGDRRALQGYF